MTTPDGSIHRVNVGGTTTQIVVVDAVTEYAGQREARSVTTPIPAGGVHTTVRPHGPRTGTFTFMFFGADAESRAVALDASLGTGAPHLLVGTAGVTSGWRWRVTGALSFERVPGQYGLRWVIRAEFTEVPA